MLIGLTGSAFAGKDTVGAYLGKHHGFRAKAFADPLRSGLKAMFGLTDSDFLPANKELPIEWIGQSARELLQSLGTEWGRDRVAREIWVRHMARRVRPIVQAGGDVVLTDLRFLSEAELVHRCGGLIWRIVRPDGRKTTHGKHVSENEGRRIVADVDIENDGTLEQLYERVDDALLFELQHGESSARRRMGI